MGADSYYWAGGRKVPLTASREVVIDVTSPAGARLSGPGLERLRAGGRSLSASLLMVPESDAAAALGGDSALPGVHPVFRSEDGALVVVLPEVRVESGDPRALDAVARSVTTAHVTERTDERLVLVPDSGRGEDALLLANSLTESRSAEVSSARFLRVVRRPGPG
jgi:hypothetical protein